MCKYSCSSGFYAIYAHLFWYKLKYCKKILVLIIFSLSKFSLNKLNCLFNDDEAQAMLEMKEVNSKDNLIIHG